MKNRKRNLNENKYIWDLSDIYKNKNEWLDDLKYCEKYLKKIKKLEGKINTVDGIYNYINLAYLSDFAIKNDKLESYYSFLLYLNVNNSEAKKLEARYQKYSDEADEQLIFFEDELNQIDVATIKELFNDDKIKKYAYAYREYMDKRRAIHSKETMVALIKSEKGKFSSSDTYDTLVASDMKYKKINIKGRKSCDANEEMLDKVLYGKYSRKDKIKVYNAYYSTPVNFSNTFASLLNTYIVDNVSEVRQTKYKSFFEMALFNYNINEKTYNLMDKYTKKMLPIYKKLIKYREKKLGYKQYFPEISINTSKYNASMKIEDAINVVKKSLNIFGDDYIKIFDSIINSKHFDAFPRKNKDTSAFELSCDDKNILPYVLMNYTGYINGISTIAHEFGHALNDYYCHQNNDNLSFYDSPSDFLEEIPSVCNEFIFFTHMLENSKTKEEKKFYVENIIELMSGTIIRQMMFSEFEKYLYDVIEKDGVHTADDLNKKWMQLTKEYFGSDVAFPEGYETRWSQIEHFYMDFYVFKYATCCTYACVLAQRMLGGDKKSIDNYKKFLATGCNMSPRKILHKTGIDIEDKKVYEEMLKYYKKLVNMYIDMEK